MVVPVHLVPFHRNHTHLCPASPLFMSSFFCRLFACALTLCPDLSASRLPSGGRVCVTFGVTRFLLDCVLLTFHAFKQGATALHWDCVQRSYEWNGISSLASWTYLQHFLSLRKGLMRSADQSVRRQLVVRSMVSFGFAGHLKLDGPPLLFRFLTCTLRKWLPRPCGKPLSDQYTKSVYKNIVRPSTDTLEVSGNWPKPVGDGSPY